MSKVIEFCKNVDKGFYREAVAAKMTAGQFLVKAIEPEPAEVEPVRARLLKKYWQADDGSYRAKAIAAFAEEAMALQKCFQQCGIRAGGSAPDTVEKAFLSSNSTALFPVFYASNIIAGQLAVSLVPQLAAMEERVNSHVVQKITLSDTQGDRTLRLTGEGANLPKTKITTAEGNVSLYKYGRMLEASYESIRLQTLDVFGAFIQRLGIQVGIDETDDLIETLIAGDGTTGSAAVDTDAEVSGTLDFDELIRLKQAFPVGYTGTTGVINDTLMRTIYSLPQFLDADGPMGVANMASNDGINVLGMNLFRWSSTGSTSFSTDRILLVDKRYAIKIVREGDFLEEADNLIDRQITRRTFSEWVGYVKLDNNATQVLDVTT